MSPTLEDILKALESYGAPDEPSAFQQPEFHTKAMAAELAEHLCRKLTSNPDPLAEPFREFVTTMQRFATDPYPNVIAEDRLFGRALKAATVALEEAGV